MSNSKTPKYQALLESPLATSVANQPAPTEHTTLTASREINIANVNLISFSVNAYSCQLRRIKKKPTVPINVQAINPATIPNKIRNTRLILLCLDMYRVWFIDESGRHFHLSALLNAHDSIAWQLESAQQTVENGQVIYSYCVYGSGILRFQSGKSRKRLDPQITRITQTAKDNPPTQLLRFDSA
jgi:hypothetical protein